MSRTLCHLTMNSPCRSQGPQEQLLGEIERLVGTDAQYEYMKSLLQATLEEQEKSHMNDMEDLFVMVSDAYDMILYTPDADFVGSEDIQIAIQERDAALARIAELEQESLEVQNTSLLVDKWIDHTMDHLDTYSDEAQQAPERAENLVLILVFFVYRLAVVGTILGLFINEYEGELLQTRATIRALEAECEVLRQGPDSGVRNTTHDHDSTAFDDDSGIFEGDRNEVSPERSSSSTQQPTKNAGSKQRAGDEPPNEVQSDQTEIEPTEAPPHRWLRARLSHATSPMLPQGED